MTARDLGLDATRDLTKPMRLDSIHQHWRSVPRRQHAFGVGAFIGLVIAVLGAIGYMASSFPEDQFAAAMVGIAGLVVTFLCWLRRLAYRRIRLNWEQQIRDDWNEQADIILEQLHAGQRPIQIDNPGTA